MHWLGIVFGLSWQVSLTGFSRQKMSIFSLMVGGQDIKGRYTEDLLDKALGKGGTSEGCLRIL